MMKVAIYIDVKNEEELNEKMDKVNAEYYEYDETKLNNEENKKLKEKLYETLLIISEYHDDLIPEKKDSIETLITNFFYWADEYNDNYLGFNEEDDNLDKIDKYLLEEYTFNRHSY